MDFLLCYDRLPKEKAVISSLPMEGTGIQPLSTVFHPQYGPGSLPLSSDRGSEHPKLTESPGGEYAE